MSARGDRGGGDVWKLDGGFVKTNVSENTSSIKGYDSCFFFAK